MVDVAAGQVLSAALFNDKVRKRIARARRIIDSAATTSTTDVGVLRLDDIPLKQGRNYRICYQANGDTTTNGDSLRTVLRYTTDGSTPSISSTVLPGSGVEADLGDAAVFYDLSRETDYTPAFDELFSVLLCVRHNQGTSSSILEADSSVFHTQIYIDDMGDDPGDTGTDV